MKSVSFHLRKTQDPKKLKYFEASTIKLKCQNSVEETFSRVSKQGKGHLGRPVKPGIWTGAKGQPSSVLSV